jgi:ligand-binding sensor domain-containing protein
VGTGAGLVRFNPVTSQSTLYTSAQTLGSIQVRSVAVSRETIGGALRDIVWLGTAAGVARLDTATELVTRFTTSDGLPSNDVQVVHVLSNGHKLFGTASGLAHYIGF